MKNNTAPARGMRDLLPGQVERRDHAQSVILKAYDCFGYRRVETPALEHIDLLCSGEGGDNEKLIYKVLKRGDKLDLASATRADDLVDFGLRYDLTVPLARFYAEHAGELPSPFRSIQIGSVWRAERPQRGRFRQFTQCDIDVLGEASILAEIELIRATVSALTELGLKGFVVRLNDRRLLNAFIAGCGFSDERIGEVFITIDKLDKIGLDGVAEELLSKQHPGEAVEAAMEVLTCMAEGRRDDALRCWRSRMDLDAEGEEVERGLFQIADIAGRSLPEGSALEIDPTLVRGMGYYTGAIFEVVMKGYPFAMAGGGRYDKMIGRISGREVPACGFSIGFERVVMVLEEQGIVPTRERRHIALLYGTDAELGSLMEEASALRSQGCSVTTVLRRKKMGKQLDELQAQGFDGFGVLDSETPVNVRSFSDE
ncbi:MAG: histidine--tRNA ligase [Planctomycetota bacterium]|nr:histidine--tRNA ligase [Planctomycetota bacterium]